MLQRALCMLTDSMSSPVYWARSSSTFVRVRVGGTCGGYRTVRSNRVYIYYL